MDYRLHKSNTVLLNVHSEDACKGRPCPIHNPSDHHMRDWPQVWREDRHMMERLCPHGVGHPDPDDLQAKGPGSIHGCDGCCRDKSGPVCAHDKVPFVKSHYGPEMVQRGRCPDCDVILLELD